MQSRYSVMVILAMFLLLSCCAGAMANPDTVSKFTDVDSSNPKLVYITYLAERNIISGFPDGSFRPLDGLTRAEALP